MIENDGCPFSADKIGADKDTYCQRETRLFGCFFAKQTGRICYSVDDANLEETADLCFAHVQPMVYATTVAPFPLGELSK
jgi:hypothetical protein